MHNQTFAIYHNLILNSAADFVYDAVSLPKHLINWWLVKCSGTPEKGARYNFYFGPEFDWYGEVVDSISARHFSFKMTQADEDWNPTSIGFNRSEKH